MEYTVDLDTVSDVLEWLGVGEDNTEFTRDTTNPNMALGIEGIRIFLALKKALSDCSDADFLDAMMTARALFKRDWLDTRAVAAPFLLSADEVEQINSILLPRLNQQLQTLGAGFSFDPYDLNHDVITAEELAPTEQTHTELVRVLTALHAQG